MHRDRVIKLNAVVLNTVMLNVIKHVFIMYHNAQCRSAQCHSAAYRYAKRRNVDSYLWGNHVYKFVVEQRCIALPLKLTNCCSSSRAENVNLNSEVCLLFHHN